MVSWVYTTSKLNTLICEVYCISIILQFFLKNSKRKSKIKWKIKSIISAHVLIVYSQMEESDINNCGSTTMKEIWSAMDTQRRGIILNWEAKYDFMQETEVQVKPDWLGLQGRLLIEIVYFLFIFKSISSYHHISFHVYYFMMIMLYFNYKTPHIINTTYYTQMCTLQTVTSSEPIIICCRMAANTGFILFCTWEKL